MSRAMAKRDSAARLLHDVGKYIARAALNLPDAGPIAPALAQLLARDLYALAPGQRASSRFGELAAGVGGAAAEAPALTRCRELLAEIDGLEARVRAGEPEALRLAARHAREIAALLHEFASTCAEAP